LDEVEQRRLIIIFDGLLEREVRELAEGLLREVDEEMIRDYYGDYKLIDLILSALER